MHLQFKLQVISGGIVGYEITLKEIQPIYLSFRWVFVSNSLAQDSSIGQADLHIVLKIHINAEHE